MTFEDYRTSFDRVAESYDAVRPGYPPQAVQAILRYASLPAGSRILEVGPGTGQMTRPFAERGYRILGLELGANLARIARENLAAYPNVVTENIALEAWPVETGAFGLFLSAQAFHWIPHEVGLQVASRALGPGGTLALAWNLDVSATTAFYRATTPLFKAYVPDDPDRPIPPASHELYAEVLAASDAFGELARERFAWRTVYDKPGFVRLLSTFSNLLALPEHVQTAFYREIERVIDAFGGRVERRYETVLVLARKSG